RWHEARPVPPAAGEMTVPGVLQSALVIAPGTPPPLEPVPELDQERLGPHGHGRDLLELDVLVVRERSLVDVHVDRQNAAAAGNEREPADESEEEPAVCPGLGGRHGYFPSPVSASLTS